MADVKVGTLYYQVEARLDKASFDRASSYAHGGVSQRGMGGGAAGAMVATRPGGATNVAGGRGNDGGTRGFSSLPRVDRQYERWVANDIHREAMRGGVAPLFNGAGYGAGGGIAAGSAGSAGNARNARNRGMGGGRSGRPGFFGFHAFGVYMSAMFGGWEVSQAQTSLAMGRTGAMTAGSTIGALSAYHEGVMGAQSGPMMGAMAAFSRLAGRGFGHESLQNAMQIQRLGALSGMQMEYGRDRNALNASRAMMRAGGGTSGQLAAIRASATMEAYDLRQQRGDMNMLIASAQSMAPAQMNKYEYDEFQSLQRQRRAQVGLINDKLAHVEEQAQMSTRQVLMASRVEDMARTGGLLGRTSAQIKYQQSRYLGGKDRFFVGSIPINIPRDPDEARRLAAESMMEGAADAKGVLGGVAAFGRAFMEAGRAYLADQAEMDIARRVENVQAARRQRQLDIGFATSRRVSDMVGAGDYVGAEAAGILGAGRAAMAAFLDLDTPQRGNAFQVGIETKEKLKALRADYMSGFRAEETSFSRMDVTNPANQGSGSLQAIEEAIKENSRLLERILGIN